MIQSYKSNYWELKSSFKCSLETLHCALPTMPLSVSMEPFPELFSCWSEHTKTHRGWVNNLLKQPIEKDHILFDGKYMSWNFSFTTNQSHTTTCIIKTSFFRCLESKINRLNKKSPVCMFFWEGFFCFKHVVSKK